MLGALLHLDGRGPGVAVQGHGRLAPLTRVHTRPSLRFPACAVDGHAVVDLKYTGNRKQKRRRAVPFLTV